MSGDEVIVTVAGVLIGPVLWTLWLFRMSRVQTLLGAARWRHRCSAGARSPAPDSCSRS